WGDYRPMQMTRAGAALRLSNACTGYVYCRVRSLGNLLAGCLRTRTARVCSAHALTTRSARPHAVQTFAHGSRSPAPSTVRCLSRPHVMHRWALHGSASTLRSIY
ncbi:hypothetical protein, partial [Xanthomonas phaseoli]